MAKDDLKEARINKKDEFYTQLVDIEKELVYYEDEFKDKVIYCNCDNPEKSKFWEYLTTNFKRLQLKGLIATYRVLSGKSKMYLMLEENKIDIKELKENGDFRSLECIEILKNADIIVTNPPFSLWREYISQLILYNKQFLILGNLNAVTYKELFPLIKENKIWLGVSIHSGDREFEVPDDYPLNAVGYRINAAGKKIIRVKGVRWFTNLDHSQRYKELVLSKIYTSKEYPKFDNYDAINVNKVSDIPKDYNGIMGVPITFLDKYNPNQFKILGCTANPEGCDIKKQPRSEKVKGLIKDGRLIGSKCVGGNSNIWIDNDDMVHVVYHRILIQKIFK